MLPPRAAHVAVASLNQTVGDWAGNRHRIELAIQEARRREASLLLLPELCISGYSLGDRLLRTGTLERSWASVQSLLPATRGMVVVVGLPVQHRGVVYNAAAILADGVLHGLVAKENLATGDVQYENRWYGAWPADRVETWVSPDGETQAPIGRQVFDAPGIGTFAVEICEDGWKGFRPGSMAALAGALLVLNPSASWFILGKHAVRRRMVTQISAEDKTAYLYASSLGCDATRLIFDGTTLVACDGRRLAEGRRFLFTEDMELIDTRIDLDALRTARMEEGSWRQQVDLAGAGKLGPMPVLTPVPGEYGRDKGPRPGDPPWWLDGTIEDPHPDPSLAWLAEAGLVPAFRPSDVPHLELELALCLGLREYLRKCKIPKIALALSGGRDSSMCAVLVSRMVRYDQPHLDGEGLRNEVGKRLITAYMSTENSGPVTRNAARVLADAIGARHLDGEIQPALDTHLTILREMTGVSPTWENASHDIALQNVQARLRGSLIWLVANLENALLITTSNLSEAAVGYATMDGDTSGGLAPLADVPKSLITRWLGWAADFYGLAGLAPVLDSPATAELRPQDRGQTDENDLMPYDILDRILYRFVQLGESPKAVFQALWPEVRARYAGDALAFAAHIRKFVRLFCFDLDPKTGFRFPPVQEPFTEELAELDAWVRKNVV
jgi:NAD+ synthase (glutamine-hydrolysing)